MKNKLSTNSGRWHLTNNNKYCTTQHTCRSFGKETHNNNPFFIDLKGWRLLQEKYNEMTYRKIYPWYISIDLVCILILFHIIYQCCSAITFEGPSLIFFIWSLYFMRSASSLLIFFSTDSPLLSTWWTTTN